MLLATRILRRFVTINLRPVQAKEQKKNKMTWEELLYSATMHSQYNIPRILKGEPKIETLMKEIEGIDPNEEWYIVDMLKLMSLCASEAYFSSTLLEDLHRFLIRHVNAPEFYDRELFYSLSEFLDIKCNISLLKNARMQAYSRLYKKLDPFQREIIAKDYFESYKSGEFINSYLEDYESIDPGFKPIELPNRDTEFEYVLLRIKNRMMVTNVVNDTKYWNAQRLTDIYALIDQYLTILENPNRLGKIVRYYQSPDIFLSGLPLPAKPAQQQKYKERLAKIIEFMYNPDFYGAFNLKDEAIESVILTNFSRNDRGLLQKSLLYICELGIKRFPTMRVETVILMEYCSYIHIGYLLCVFRAFLNKVKAFKTIPKSMSYKPAKEILTVVNSLEKLKFRKILENLIEKEDMTEFYEMFLYAVRGFIFGDKAAPNKEPTVYMNLMPQYVSSQKYLPSFVEQVGRLPQSIQRLLHNEKSLGIQSVVDYTNDIRSQTQLPQLGIFITQLQSLETVLSISDGQIKHGATSFKQMSNNILNIKTSMNYICSPRVFDTFLRIKALIKRRFKNFDWNLIDNQTSSKVKMEFDDVWNSLEQVTQKNKHSFIPDPRYTEYLFEIETGFVPPLLNFGRSTNVNFNNSNLNFSTNFTCTQQNILQNVGTSKILSPLYQQSNLKNLIQQTLKQRKIRYTKNYVDYPFYADFLIEGTHKMVIYSIDYTKTFMRNEESPVTIRSLDSSVDYFLDLKYQIVPVLYSNVKDGKLDESVLKKLDSIK